MSEVLAGDDISCRYCHTKDQIANGLTKVIVPGEWGHMLQQLCLEQGPTEHALVAVKTFIASAERFALTLHQRVTKQDLVQLLSYLPHGNADRASDKVSAHAFTVGAYSRGYPHCRWQNVHASVPNCVQSTVQVHTLSQPTTHVYHHHVVAGRALQCTVIRGIGQDPSTCCAPLHLTQVRFGCMMLTVVMLIR